MGAGLRNAVLILIVILASHVAIVKPSVIGLKPGPGRPPASAAPPARSAGLAWPPGPGDVAKGMPAFPRPVQTPRNREDEERAALHRMVFSGVDDEYEPELSSRDLPDYSRVHLAAESSATSDLPMYYIDGSANNVHDGYLSGIESWGASYLPVST